MKILMNPDRLDCTCNPFDASDTCIPLRPVDKIEDSYPLFILPRLTSKDQQWEEVLTITRLHRSVEQSIDQGVQH